MLEGRLWAGFEDSTRGGHRAEGESGVESRSMPLLKVGSGLDCTSPGRGWLREQVEDSGRVVNRVAVRLLHHESPSLMEFA